MQTWIALLRGINVGGATALKMKDLVKLLEDLACQDVKTYIQSGNAAFRSKRRKATSLADEIRTEIESRHGFGPQVMLLTLEQLEKAIGANPFPDAEGQPQTLHLFFLSSVPPAADLDGMEKVRTESERFELIDQVLYLHTPEGFARSKLAKNAERCIGVPITARNWRSMSKIVEMAQEL